MDFESMTGPQLVAAWNEMVLTAIDVGIPVNSVKKFADQKSGVTRCIKLHAQIQAKRPLTADEVKRTFAATDKTKKEDDEGIPEFLKRKTPKGGGEPLSVGVAISEKRYAASTRPILTVDKTKRDWRIPKGMSDEEGAKMLSRQQEEKKQKAAVRIKTMQEKKAERDAEKLVEINAKREAQGLELLTSLTEKVKPSSEKQETKAMRKSKKTAKAKSASTSGNGKWMADDAVITKLEKGKEYDPRKGTTASKLWDAIKNGMTVGAYKEKGKAPAMPYLRWFIAHNYVKVNT